MICSPEVEGNVRGVAEGEASPVLSSGSCLSSSSFCSDSSSSSVLSCWSSSSLLSVWDAMRVIFVQV